MHPRARTRIARLAGVAALSLALLVTPAVASADEVWSGPDTIEPAAAPPGPPPEGSFTSPAHVWVDPTHPVSDGRIGFTGLELHFPLPTTHWVAHASAPRMSDGVTHCGLTRTDFGLTFSCESTGTALPGEFSLAVDVRSEGGDNFAFSIPMTVCPLTGCSPLFELALSGASWEVCPGEELGALEPGRYEFNVAWNAEDVAFGSLAAAGGDAYFVSEPPADDAQFAARGTLQNPGSYVVPVVVTDEFGGEHSAGLTIAVKSAASCGQLAATGADAAFTPALALGMLVLVASGIATLLFARRRTSAL